MKTPIDVSLMLPLEDHLLVVPPEGCPDGQAEEILGEAVLMVKNIDKPDQDPQTRIIKILSREGFTQTQGDSPDQG